MPPATQNLLVINIGLWLVCSLMSGFGDKIYGHLGLHYWGAGSFNPLQFVTYMFLQAPLGGAGGIGHIFFNMFALYMFGRILEATWGTRRFLCFYLVCGVGAAFIQEAVWSLTFHDSMVASLAEFNNLPEAVVNSQLAQDPAAALSLSGRYADSLLTIGASGAVFGLLLGFGCVFPNVDMYIFFIPVPVKAKYLVAGYAVIGTGVRHNGGCEHGGPFCPSRRHVVCHTVHNILALQRHTSWQALLIWCAATACCTRC